MFASRTEWNRALNSVAARLHALRRSGARILDLTESNPTKCALTYPLDLLSPLADRANLVYEPSPRGLPQAREAIAAYYDANGIHVHPDQIFLTASTSEAYSLLLRLLVEPGERILAPRPSYPLFDFLAALNDAAWDAYPLVREEGWRIDFDALARTVTKKKRGSHPAHKALILVNPNNPTGSFLKRRELAELIRLAEKENLFLISDEVFADYAWEKDPERIPFLAKYDSVPVASLGGISKTLGLPQMKLGWIVLNGPADKRKEAGERLEVILDTYLSVNTAVQRALPRWLERRVEIQAAIKKRLLENRASLGEFASKHPSCQLLPSEGGWYAVLRLPRTRSEEEWVLEFLAEDHVYAHPGYFFDFDEEAYSVVSLLPPPEVFHEGISRILARVSRDGGAYPT